MEIPLYSDAHKEEAKLLFSDCFYDTNWLKKQWTSEEINECNKVMLGKKIMSMDKKSYEEYIGLDPMLKQNKEIIDFVIKNLPNKNVRILSLGCGLGDKEIYLSRVGYKNIVAFDTSPVMNYLKGKYKDEVLFVSQADARSIPFEDDTFDVVLMLNVIYAIPKEDLSTLFSEINRVLKKNGRFIISTSATLSMVDKIKYYLMKYIGFLFKESDNSKIMWRKVIGWNRDRNEIEKYLPYEDYKIISYDGSVCLDKKLCSNNKFISFIKTLLGRTMLGAYYDFWIAAGKKE